MNRFFLVLAITGATLAAFFLTQRYAVQRQNGPAAIRVAIFYPATHPAMTQIAQGIQETMNAQSGTQQYSFKIFNANGNKTLLLSQAEEIVAGHYDIALTVGFLCTKTLYERARKRSSSLPIIFTAVEKPDDIGIENNYPITGVTDAPDFDKQLDVLLKIKPQAKNLLLVYDPSGNNFQERKNLLTYAATQRGLQLKSLEVYNSNDIAQKVPSALGSIDTVIIFTDHTVVAALESLVSTCNRYGVTLYASDLNSADRGAALAFGVNERDHGVDAAQKALRVIDQGIVANSIPLSRIDTFRLNVNKKTMPLQGIPLDEQRRDILTTMNVTLDN